MFMHVHLNALRYFRETVHYGSMRRAAEALNVAASALNRQILKLEDQLECRLFERSAVGVQLTAAGEVVYRYALRLDQDLGRMMSDIDDLRGLRRGHVSIACEVGIARDLLPAVLADFRAEFPRVTYQIDIEATPAIERAVAGGEVDIGLTAGSPPGSYVSFASVTTVPMGVVMAPDNPLAERPSLTLRDIAREDVVQLIKLGPTHHVALHRAMREASVETLVVRTNSPDGITCMVKSGFGIAVRTPVGILGDLARGELAFVPLEDTLAGTQRFAVCVQPRRALPVASAVLVERLNERLTAFGLSLWERFGERSRPVAVPAASGRQAFAVAPMPSR